MTNKLLDQKLRQLVRDGYSRAEIIAAAKRLAKRRAGRRGGDVDAKWGEAIVIEQRMEEFRAQGEQAFFQRATAEQYAATVPHDKQTDEGLKKFQKRIKNRLDEWHSTQRSMEEANAVRRRTFRFRRRSPINSN